MQVLLLNINNFFFLSSLNEIFNDMFKNIKIDLDRLPIQATLFLMKTIIIVIKSFCNNS